MEKWKITLHIKFKRMSICDSKWENLSQSEGKRRKGIEMELIKENVFGIVVLVFRLNFVDVSCNHESWVFFKFSRLIVLCLEWPLNSHSSHFLWCLSSPYIWKYHIWKFQSYLQKTGRCGYLTYCPNKGWFSFLF